MPDHKHAGVSIYCKAVLWAALFFGKDNFIG